MSYFTGTATARAADGTARPAPAEGAAYPAYPLPTAPGRPTGQPLTQRLRPGHWIAIDCVVGAFFAVCDLFALLQGNPTFQVLRPLWLLFAVVVFFSVGLRRRAPGVAFGALLILGLVLAGVAPHASVLLFLTAAYVLYTVTVTSGKRTGAAALGLILAIMVAIAAGGISARERGSGNGGDFVPVALANVIGWITGYSVRQRRLYIVSLQHQAASSAVAEERLRIARELHDVVAHSMSVIAVQAGYGQYVIDVSPDGARDALGAIQATSRDALDEMRRMLGVLRQQSGIANPAGMPGGGAPPAPAGTQGAPGGAAAEAAGRLPGDQRPGALVEAAPLAPAPGLAELGRLIQRTGGAGIQVSLTVSGQRRPLPAGVDLSAYRIIQEALTNVVKHAGVGAACTVEVYYGAIVLGVRVTDNGAGRQGEYATTVTTAGPRHGIIGMQERAHLCGGEFDAGPLADGGFQVAVTLPVPAADDPVDAGPVAAGPVAARPPVTGAGRLDAVGHGDMTIGAGTGLAEGQR
jgi:signal transduction histidine kinase